MRVLRLEISVYNIYIPNQFQPLLLKRGGVKSVSRGEKLLRLLSQLRPRIRPLFDDTVKTIIDPFTFRLPVLLDDSVKMKTDSTSDLCICTVRSVILGLTVL